MGRKNVLSPHVLLAAGDMSSDIQTSEIDVRNTDNIGIALTWTGDAVGTFFVDATIDGTNWSALNFGTDPAANGTGDTHLLNINQLPYETLRVRFVWVSGSGSLKVTVMTKMIGG
jgi:hypothetical protein